MRTIVAILLVLALAGIVEAKPARMLHVGDRIGKLTVGLHALPAEKIPDDACGPGTGKFERVFYVYPGRLQDLDHASVAVIKHNGVVFLAASYDEDDLDTPVVKYKIKRGMVVNVYTIDLPSTCSLL